MAMSHTLSLQDFVFVPASEATTPPPGLIEHIADHWWSVDAQDRIAFYAPWRRHGRARVRGGGSPQCNSSEAVQRKVAEIAHPWAVDVWFLPSVFRRIDPADFL
jgi:hypothetical protein